ncbi:hypothetical protein [uncultured Selenomonas sp.]|uniref:hypothetical protein n=1 Tax=uncultured Selenomonas sp. TaxID=159275 RepID=UPI0028E7DE91|nr:hypothetical protein [uncultured Selenomonas sp.]
MVSVKKFCVTISGVERSLIFLGEENNMEGVLKKAEAEVEHLEKEAVQLGEKAEKTR